MSKLALLAATAAIVLLSASPALGSGNAVIEDCTDDGKIDRRYSQGDYADAINNIPTDVDEYTDCRERIRRAQLAARGGGGGGSQGGGSAGGTAPGGVTGVAGTPGPAEHAAIERVLERRRDRPVRLNGTVVQPGESGGPFGQAAATTNSMPLPLALAGLGVLAAGLGLAGSSAPFVRRLLRR